MAFSDLVDYPVAESRSWSLLGPGGAGSSVAEVGGGGEEFVYGWAVVGDGEVLGGGFVGGAGACDLAGGVVPHFSPGAGVLFAAHRLEAVGGGAIPVVAAFAGEVGEAGLRLEGGLLGEGEAVFVVYADDYEVLVAGEDDAVAGGFLPGGMCCQGTLMARFCQPPVMSGWWPSGGWGICLCLLLRRRGDENHWDVGVGGLERLAASTTVIVRLAGILPKFTVKVSQVRLAGL